MIKAAFRLFRERGFSATSMLEIATRAHVSKRDLYAEFGNKHALLATIIGTRTRAMRRSLDDTMPVPPDRPALMAALVEFGRSILASVCQPDVLSIYRLAITECERAPEIARMLDGNGREANHRALAAFISKAQAHDLMVPGDPAALAARYFAVLWGDLLLRLLLRVCDPPDPEEMKARAQAAMKAIAES